MARQWLQLTSFLILLLASPLFASGPTGTLTGTITDPSGAVVAKARVIVRDEGTNATRDAETNQDGDYTLALLPPGRYFVAVESKGFRRSVIHGVSVDVDQTVRIDFPLQVGALTEEVNVKDTPPAIQTDTSTLGQVINNRLVQELPLNERNFLAFALLVPGSQLPAEGSENSTQGGALSVNGAREQSNNFLLDGVDNNDPYLNQYVALPSIDAIEEFKVQSSSYSAEFGHGGGAQVNVVLKSGTNQFHGSLFEFFRNRQMDAKNFFDFPSCTANSVPGTCADIPRFDRNQFGGTLGGPLRKDKTFFFLSYEGLRLRQATTRQATVPTAAQWQAAAGLAQELFGCPLNPSCQVGQNVFNLYPAGNVGSDLTNSNIFLSSPIIRNRVNLISVKVDEHASRGDTVSLHYFLTDENRFSPFDPVNSFTSLPGYGSFTLNHGQNAALEWTRVFRSTVVNEFRLGFTRMRANFLGQNHGNDIGAQLGFPDVLTNPVDLGTPNVNLIGFDGIGEPINYPQDRHDTTLQLSDNVAWTVGRNQFKIGADLRHVRIDNYLDFLSRGDWFFSGNTAAAIQGYPPPPGSPPGTPPVCLGPPPGSPPGTPPEDPQTCSLVQLLGGVPDFALAVSGNTFNSLRSHGASVYVQDDIHVIPRFLLNVGLRYEFNSPPVEALNRFSVPVLIPSDTPQFTLAGTNGIPRATYSSTRRNIAPRIGIAWRPLKSERWVVRSAYGIFYDVPISQINIFPRINPPFYNLALFQQNPDSCPGGLCTVQDILSQTGQQAGVVQGNMISLKFRDGYMQQWNADLQYEVQPNWMVDVAYVGSKGTHLSDVLDRNQTDPGTGQPPFPQFSSILFVESNANSSYNSLQLRSEKRMSHGLALLLAYTYSKSFDDISSVFAGSVGSGLPQNSRDLAADRGPPDFNAVHRFSGSFVYDLPLTRLWAHGSDWSGRLLGNWQAGGIVTVQSGSPFTVVLAGGSASSAAAFGNPARPDLVGDPFRAGPVAVNPTCVAPSQVRVPESWFNICAFAQPSPGALGTEGRNILTGPGFTNLDFSLAKSVPLRAERHQLQFRGDIFNLFNHPNFDIPSHGFPCSLSNPQPCSENSFGQTTFGEVLSANSNGNKPPRQIQLSVKYIF